MNKNIIFLTVFFCFFTAFTGGFDFTITTLSGTEQTLTIYAGKRLMVVVLPTTHTPSDSAFLLNLDSLSEKYKDSITMIGIPSYEDGYSDDSLNALITWYNSMLDSSFITAQGMYTKKNSPLQSDLFSWLTHTEKNGHFDDDVTGPKTMFFIASDGSLYGLITSGVELDEELLLQLLQPQNTFEDEP